VKTFREFREQNELSEAPLVMMSQSALKVMSDKLVKRLSKEGANRRIQMMTQIGKIIGVQVKVLPNNKVELR